MGGKETVSANRSNEKLLISGCVLLAGPPSTGLRFRIWTGREKGLCVWTESFSSARLERPFHFISFEFAQLTTFSASTPRHLSRVLLEREPPHWNLRPTAL